MSTSLASAISKEGARNPSRPPRFDLTALVFLGLFWAFLLVLTNPLGDFPLNDDWVYALAVQSLLETGRFSLPSAASVNVFAQAYWGALFCLPFGFSFTALRVSTIVLGTGGIFALYLLLRELGIQRRLALVGAFNLAVNPIYLELSASFMTDVPFTALVTTSLWLYVRGVRRKSATSLSGAFALAFVTILIRQFGLVLPLAFGVAHIARKGLKVRVFATAVLPFVLGIALHVTYEHWLVATGRTPSVSHLLPGPAFFIVRNAAHLIAISLYVGLYMAPLLACLTLAWRSPLADGNSSRTSSLWRPFAALVALLVALAPLGNMLPGPGFGNILIPSGLGPLTLRDTFLLGLNRPTISSVVTILWDVTTALSACSTVLVVLATAHMAAKVAQNLLRPEGVGDAWPQVLVLTLTGAYAGAVLLAGTQALILDRYLMPFIVPLSAVLLMEPRPSLPVRKWSLRAVPCFLLLALYAALSSLATHDYIAWNRARWRATDFLLRAGVTPHHIDGGYEFNGWHLHSPGYRVSPGKSYWWVDDDEYVVASGALTGYEELARFGFSRWLGFSESSVLVLHRVPPPGAEQKNGTKKESKMPSDQIP
jgi:hypothetical protein